jgi:CHAT domain-containing protein
VLWQRRQHRRRHHHHQWRTATYALICCLLWLTTGCHRVSDSTWQQRYADTRRELWHGHHKAAQEHADRYSSDAGKNYPIWQWRFAILKADAQRRQPDPRLALKTLAQEPPSDLPFDIQARRSFVLAMANCQLSHFDGVDSLLSRTEQLIPPSAPDLKAEMALARGYCAFVGNNQPAAFQFYEQAAEPSGSGENFVRATALNSIGYMLMQKKQYDAAIDRLSDAAKLTDSPLIEERALGNLGSCLSELGDFKRAMEASDRAEKLAATLGSDRTREAWLLDLGHDLSALTEFTKGEGYLQQALAIAQHLSDKDMQWRALNNLTGLYLRSRNLAKARESWKQEVDALGSLASEKTFPTSQAFTTFNRAKIALAEKDISAAEQGFAKVLANRDASIALRSKAQGELGRTLAAQNRFADANTMFRRGLETAENALCDLKPEHRIDFLDKSQFYDSYVLFLIAQNKPEQALAVSERGRSSALRDCSKSQNQFAGLDLPALHARLKQRHQVILAYWVTDEQSYLWMITGDGVKLFPLPEHAELNRQQQAHNDEVQAQRRLDESPNGSRLYETLIGPARSMVPNGSNIIVVPSRVLCLVNFETLIVPGERPHYWIEDVEVQVASSIAPLLNPEPKRSGTRKQLLLVGNPSEVTTEFPSLKHAAEEMREIAAHFTPEQETILSGEAATPKAYLSSNPAQFRFIHFVTHGTANEQIPIESAIILSGTPASYRLYGREILDAPLNADLVTISACYGAGKRWYLSEATVGLEWAFMRAGARQVIAALWEVDDTITPRLMDGFYSDLTKGTSTAAALRNAKLAMLHSQQGYNRPYYWGALQLYTHSLAPR